ncbi:caspase family protein [Streptomyces sp. NRRL F-2664]|uniref:VMAP-C domain-containing protein n=1 Tax=Streptomyces sp. NRRL F-2664 TaxID=1463842 RepID=UPI00068AC806|nr:caspase family protein [Streptomyces sp. NRRL F-2664]
MIPADFLPPALGPQRTFALVAGVERYDVSHRWNLRGPARDALRFAHWLTGPAQVPPGNLRLLLSPLDAAEALDWPDSPAMAALRAACRPATEENVKAALLDELPQCDGDLLWIFWAGHGYLGPRQELMLPCADARPSQIRHLNLDSALRWWRTDLVKHRRFPLQAALVDSCRVDAPRDARWNFGSTDYGGGSSVPGRRQFRLYASREGEAAQNDAERGAGRFTEALLTELGGRSVRESVTGLPTAARSIHRTFRELRERGEGWQLPQFLVDRDWDACSFLDDDPTAIALPRAARLDQQAWDGLGVLFEGRALPRCAYEAYAWAFRTAGCTTPVGGGLPGDGLLDVVQDLDERQGGRGGMPLAVPFVRFLADRSATAGDAQWAARLKDWVDTTRERLALPALPPPPPPARTTVVHVALEPPPDGGPGLRARMWLRGERTEHIWESRGAPVRLDTVREELVRQLALVGAASADAAGAGPPAAGGVDRVEFHVPYELLDADFDQWPVPRGPAGRTRALGLLHQVVVRCPQERTDTRPEWHTSWRWLCTRGGRHPEAVRVVEEAEVTDVLGMELAERPAPACVVAHTTSAPHAGLLEAVLEGGVPVAVWRRGGGAPARPLLDLLAPAGPDGRPDPGALDVLALPARVREVRRAAAGAAAAAARAGPDAAQRPPREDQLVILWDDPDDIPGSRSLA